MPVKRKALMLSEEEADVLEDAMAYYLAVYGPNGAHEHSPRIIRRILTRASMIRDSFQQEA